jgi:hypothetical protein
MSASTCRKCGSNITDCWRRCPSCGMRFPVAGPVITVVAAASVLYGATALGLKAYRYFIPLPHIASDDGFRHVAIQLITKELRDPKSANFAAPEEWTFERQAPNKCLMRAWAEARDALGVQVRNHFTIVLDHDGKDYWEVKYLKFDESEQAIGQLE